MMPGGVDLAGNVIQALGWALLHFVWQGALIGLLCWAVLKAQKASRPALRYWTAMTGLAFMAAAPLATFFAVLDGLSGPGATAGAAAALLPGLANEPVLGLVSTEGAVDAARRLEPLLPTAVALWLAGVMVMALRLARDVRQINRLVTRDVTPVPARWERVLARLCSNLGVRRPVRILESCRVSVPLVIGWLRPTILIPPSALMGLTPRQLELIIAHELAHVRRADWLFNLFQVLVETVLFYHPAVRLLSRRIRVEREQCCDDIVVEATGDTLTYARALTEVEGLRAALTARMAIGASDGQLAGRVTRLIAPPRPQRGFIHWAPVALLVSSAVITAGSMDRWETRMAAPEPVASEPVASEPVAALGASADSIPAAGDSGPAAPASPLPAHTPDPAVGGDSPGSAADAGPDATPSTGVEPVFSSPAMTVVAGPSAEELAPDAGKMAENRATSAGSDTGAQDQTVLVAAGRVDDRRSPPAPAVAVASLPPILPTGLESQLVLGQERAIQAPDRAGSQLPPKESSGENPAATASSVEDFVAAGSRPESAASSDPAAANAEVVPVDTAPVYSGGKLVRGKAPAFPRRARTRAEGGQVVVAYTIDRRGRVRDLEIVESSARDFSLAVKRAMKGWRFDPYTRDGEIVERRVERTFDFNLEAGGPALEDDSRCGNATASRLCRRYASAGDPEAPPPDPKPAEDCLVTGSRICGRHAAGQHVVVVYEAD
jgi:TonB family protein